MNSPSMLPGVPGLLSVCKVAVWLSTLVLSSTAILPHAICGKAQPPALAGVVTMDA